MAVEVSGIVLQRRVDWQDTDAAGHYHHSTVIRWVEAAEAELLHSIGERNLFGRIPRVNYRVDYLARLWFGDTASIALSIDTVGTTSMTYHFEITRIPASRSTPPELAARGTLTIVHAPEGRSHPWPSHLATALRALVEPPPRAAHPPLHTTTS
ncbi:thioesterase family protein [Nocardia sp. NPDC047648]|uniref:acyl-CoA thioesterase n=1 Tax=Nocardia sp. NPDC047648 TaxID=3155625 RepID=UPI0033DFCC2D